MKSWDVSRFEGKSGTKSGTEIPKTPLRIWDRRMNVCNARSPSSGKLFHFCKKILREQRLLQRFLKVDFRKTFFREKKVGADVKIKFRIVI